MAIVIGWTAVKRWVRVGRAIVDGTASTVSGVLRWAQNINHLLARRRKGLINDWYANPPTFAAYGTLPVGQANGARVYVPITPPWTEVYVRIRARTVPAAASAYITVHSRTATCVVQVSAAGFNWVAGATSLGVSYTGVEEIWYEIEPEAGETCQIKGIAITEASRTTLV